MSELINTVKNSMMITSTNKVIEGNIESCINACKLDLRLAGVNKVNDTDALTIQALIFYTKANMNYNYLGERFQKAYEALKNSMALSGDYTEEDNNG